MTERLSDERLDELAPLLSCTRSGQVLDQDEPCSCVDCSWDAGIAESCLALLDEVRERRAGGPVRQIGSLDPGTRFKFRGQSGEALRLDTQDHHGRVGYTYLDMGEVQFCVPDLDVTQLDKSEWA